MEILADINVNIVRRKLDLEISDIKVIQVNSTKSVFQKYICGENLSSKRVVMLNDGKIFKADATNINHIDAVIGLTKTAGVADEVIEILQFGIIQDSSWNFSPNQAVYFDSTGEPTHTAPTSGFIQKIGTSIDAHTLFFHLYTQIKL